MNLPKSNIASPSWEMDKNKVPYCPQKQGLADITTVVREKTTKY
jgi:hypothetical protein